MRFLAIVVALLFLLVGCRGERERGKGIPFFQRGRQLVLKKDFAAAREAFEQCLRRQPDYGPAHLELGMLSEEPLQDLWRAAWHYREFVRLSPEHAERLVVERWLGRIERRLLAKLAERYPDTAVDGDLAQVRAERDDLLERLRRAAVLYTTLLEEKEALQKRLDTAEEERLANLRDQARAEFADEIPVEVPPSRPLPPELPEAKPPSAAVVPKPAPSEAKATAAPVRTHEIVGGDTLAGISRQYYGSIRHWPKLQVYNRDLLHGGTMLIRGKTIRIPALAELEKITIPSPGKPDQ